MYRSDNGTTYDIPEDPDGMQGIDTLLLTNNEQQLMISNITARHFPQDICVPELIELQAEATPDAVAIVMDSKQLSYKELNQRANQLAHHLRKCGVHHDVLVGLCVERSLDMVIGLLGIWKAGGAYVPLDPSYPDERLTFMLDDARISVLVTRQAMVQRLAPYVSTMICLDCDAALLTQEDGTNLLPEITTGNLAYVIYTSGSTGRPKGVQITHLSVLNLVLWYRKTFELTDKDRTTQFASPSFDVTVKELWPPLSVGASVHIIDDQIRGVPIAMRDWLVDHAITLAIVPTIMAEGLIAQEWPAKTPLRLLLTGGDKLHNYPSQAIPFTLINNYGPTETTVVASCEPVIPVEHPSGPPSIGRPIANTQMYILDEHLRQVAPGEAGELHIGGAGLAKGYLNRPELTAERFITNPFSQEWGGRLYKTGDLVRVLPDGCMEFLGRNDEQVKVRGYRIELGEIEAALKRCVVVRDVAVVAQEDVLGDKRLIAYITLQQNASATIPELQQYAQQHLPAYMVPSVFMLLDVMPITTNGKIDRRALPAPEVNRSTTEDPYIEPASFVQSQLVQIWEELLDVRPIGIRDNFFSLGGHSLLAARLLERIDEVYGKKITLTTLFAGPTIEQLTDALMHEVEEISRVSVIAVQTGGSLRPFFFLHGDWTGGAFYCFALARVLGPDQPFYVLEPYKFGGQRSISSLEEMAATHIEAMRAIQPEGPYFLGGFCNGGLVAYEIARQLAEVGQQIEFLGLINPPTSDEPNMVLSIISRIGQVLHIQSERQTNWYLRVRHALRHIYRLLRPGDERVADFHKLTAIDPRLKNMFPPMEALYNDYIGVFSWLAGEYELRAYKGKITFYWSADEPIIQETWNRLPAMRDTQGMEHQLIPGTHMTCVTDYTETLAERLHTSLSLAQEAALGQAV